MQELLAQLALVSTLLDNWDGIELRLPARSDALTARMATVAQSLAAARSPDEIAIALDDLLDLVLDTPAESFVRTLMERAAPPGRDDVRVRSQVSALDVTQVASANGASTRRQRSVGAHGLSDASDPRVVPVFFATNRSIPDAGVSGVDAYSGNLAEHTSFGLAYVTIPVGHRRGRVETPRWWAPWIDKERPDCHVIVRSLERLDASAFATRLEGAAGAQALDVLVFLHGYNVTFEQAARRAAQIAFDSRFDGIIVLFSWASAGRTFAYAADEERAITLAGTACTAARDAGGRTLGQRPPARAQHGHPRSHARAGRPSSAGVEPGEAVFVAADVYVPLFRQKLPRLRELAGGRMTLYASRGDLALRMSSLLHAAERIGRIRGGGPFVAEGIETIDASAIDTSLVGHSYFSDQPQLLDDISTLLGARTRANSANRVRDAGGYWSFDVVGRS